MIVQNLTGAEGADCSIVVTFQGIFQVSWISNAKMGLKRTWNPITEASGKEEPSRQVPVCKGMRGMQRKYGTDASSTKDT
jgi:hypothetical protein